MIGQLPLDDQLRAFQETLSRNDVLMKVLDGAYALDLPGWYVGAGAIVQTIWNVVTDRPPTEGIRDYDLVYFDGADLSWEAEDKVIRRALDIHERVEARNEARVHLWYEEKFGVPCPPYACTEDAIDTFPSTTCCVGVRIEDGRWRVYAPHGLSDAFNLVVRPNLKIAPQHVYQAKTARWKQQWPALTILPWPA